MKESISIHRVSEQQTVHPDAIHAKASFVSLQSVLDRGPEEHRLRPVETDELAQRPLQYVALDSEIAGEGANVGHTYVKAPLGPRQHAEVSSVFVEESHGGNNIGGALIQLATTDALRQGWTPLAYAANPHARRVFERLGYEEVEPETLPTQAYNEKAVGYAMEPASEAARLLLEASVEVPGASEES